MAEHPHSFLPTMIEAAKAGGDVLLRHFENLRSLRVEAKKSSDFVSEADLEAEKAIFDRLRAAYPAFGAHLEEGGVIEGEDKRHRWIVDPLDGTTNFIHGIPHYSVSIALALDGEPIAGVVLNPVVDELFSAAKGDGATLNGQAISASTRSHLPEMIFGTGLPFKDKQGHEAFARELIGPMQSLAGVRRFGSAALDLSYVACGRFDAFWEHDLNAYDVAAGIIIVREAGGAVTRLNGDEEPLPFRDILATNGPIHQEARDLILA